MLIGSSLRVSSRSSCVLRQGMLHICNGGEDVSVISCVYTEESATIAPSRDLFPCDYSELSKKQRCREIKLLGRLQLVLTHSGSLAILPQAKVECCRPVDRLI